MNPDDLDVLVAEEERVFYHGPTRNCEDCGDPLRPDEDEVCEWCEAMRL